MTMTPCQHEMTVMIEVLFHSFTYSSDRSLLSATQARDSVPDNRDEAKKKSSSSGN